MTEKVQPVSKIIKQLHSPASSRSAYNYDLWSDGRVSKTFVVDGEAQPTEFLTPDQIKTTKIDWSRSLDTQDFLKPASK